LKWGHRVYYLSLNKAKKAKMGITNYKTFKTRTIYIYIFIYLSIYLEVRGILYSKTLSVLKDEKMRDRGHGLVWVLFRWGRGKLLKTTMHIQITNSNSNHKDGRAIKGRANEEWRVIGGSKAHVSYHQSI
jgi:hypothetical protein